MTRAPLALLLAATLTFAPALAQEASSGVVNVPTSVQLTVAQEQQVERIGMKIHCPICSGESIAQSQTDISRQMMNQVREMVKAGRPEQEILNSFVASYGERILLEPPKRGITSLLWTLPVALLIFGALMWWLYLQRASRPPEGTLSEAEEQRIRDLLRDTE
ncbi:hypothetical protein Dxin01_02198 [Deinococcus xinjiangensis]|uniref:Cytochrome c-type biogenesis protein n=1 Tax=Deinococcus xinjiangensis TaxID=457454 RepID=A0ABP9VB22_9DEIO